jgi:hypothetical protein
MNKITQAILQNIFYIFVLQMLCVPFGIFLWFIVGHWHIFHIFLIVGFFYSILLIYDTMQLIIKHVRFVDNDKEKTPQIHTK